MKKNNKVHLKCAVYARVPGPDEDVLVLCKCKSRYHCKKACRVKDKIMTSAKEMIKHRDKETSELAKQDNVLYHFILRIGFWGKPKRWRYIGVFVELAGLEQKIQETVQDFRTVVPSSAFLAELLHAPVNGFSGIEQLRLPLQDPDVEKQSYIKRCYRTTYWSFQKLLYVVVFDTPKVHTDHYEKEERFVSTVEVLATFGSLLAAVQFVKERVHIWNKEKGGNKGKLITVDRDSVRGEQLSAKQKVAIAHIRIIKRTLWQAGALVAAEGKAITVPPESRDDFAKHMRLIEHVDPEPTTKAATVKPDSQSSSKKHVHSDEGNEEISKKCTRPDEEDKEASRERSQSGEEGDKTSKKRDRSEEENEGSSKRIRVAEHVE